MQVERCMRRCMFGVKCHWLVLVEFSMVVAMVPSEWWAMESLCLDICLARAKVINNIICGGVYEAEIGWCNI